MTPAARRPMSWAGNIALAVALVWGIGTGLLSCAWALGSDLGLDQLGTRIQEQATAREPAFIATVWVSALARFAVATLAVAMSRAGSGRWRRILVALGIAGGAGLTLYGLAGMTQAALALGGVIDVPPSMGDHAVRWYLFLWEPLWLIGGLALLGTALATRRR